MRVAILGSGPAGSAMARALARPGVELSLASRDFDRARRLASEIGADACPDDASAARDADVVLFAVHEDWLASRAEALAVKELEPRVALHLAGSRGPDALAALADAGWSVGVLHPLVALRAAGPARVLRGASFAVAGDAAATNLARRVVDALDGEVLRVRPGAEARYHAGAALVASGAIALVAGAVDAVESTLDASDARATARRALASLLSSVAENLLAEDAAGALTGPVARGSAATVARHLEALDGDAAAYYRGVLPRLVALAADRLGREEREALEALLRG